MIIMNNVYLENAMKKLNIKCKICLDTNKLWDNRGSIFAVLDGRGHYDIFNCHKCSNGWWAKCSWSNDTMFNDLPIFHREDTDINKRLVALSEKITLYNLMNNEMRPFTDAQKIVKIQNEKIPIVNKQEEEQKLDKQLEEQHILDKDSKCLWWYYMNETHKNVLKSEKVEIEIGKIADNISTCFQASGGNILAIASFLKNMKVELSRTITNGSFKKKQIEQQVDADNRVTYIILTIDNNIIEKEGSCSSCFGCSIKEYNLYINYKIVKPKNLASKIQCNEIISRDINLDITS